MKNPSDRLVQREANIKLFKEYHYKYPTHGYRWLNAKIKLDLGVIFSDNYAQRLCKYSGIKSISKRFKKYKASSRENIYPNLLLADMNITKPFELIVSDMTVLYIKGIYHEITFYMDLFNNEIVAYSVSLKKGDRNTYISGKDEIIKIKEETYPDYETILHSDQGSVYASKDFNQNLYIYNITRSMSRAGTPTDNGAMEAINGWVKEEILQDFKINESEDILVTIKDYIYFFNNLRPSYSLNYKTPKEVKDEYLSSLNV